MVFFVGRVYPPGRLKTRSIANKLFWKEKVPKRIGHENWLVMS